MHLDLLGVTDRSSNQRGFGADPPISGAGSRKIRAWFWWLWKLWENLQLPVQGLSLAHQNDLGIFP